MFDIDRSKAFRMKYQIKLIPTFYFLKEGKLLEHETGSMSRKVFEEKIKENFKL